MHFVLLVDFGPQPPAEELLNAHLDWLLPRFSEGFFILTGGLEGTDGHPPSAMAVLEADSLEAAREVLNTDPFIMAGACTHRVMPYIARVRTDGMDGRFGDEVRVIPVEPAGSESAARDRAAI